LAHFFLEDGDGVEEALPLLRLPRERKILENAWGFKNRVSH
jgi:hypothetical protein